MSKIFKIPTQFYSKYGIVPAGFFIFILMWTNFLPAQVNGLQAGASSSNITPDLGEPIVGNWNSPPATYIHDNLHARTLVQTELRLAVRKPDEVLQARMEKVRNNPEGAEPVFHRREQSYARRIAQLENDWPDSIDVVLQAFRIGDLGIASSPFETFAETGLEIKEKSPMDHTFTIELANGAFGYLPTPEQHKLGGYETWMGTNRVEKGTTIKLVNELMKLFDKVNKE